MNRKLVVFDLDGTLNRIDLYAVPSHQQALAEFGRAGQVTDQQIIDTFGGRAEDYCKILLPNASAEDQQRYLKRQSELEREYIKKFHASFPGTPEMLDTLHQRGYQTAVCSNASLRYITMVLQTLQLIDKIDYIQHLRLGVTKVQTLSELLASVNPVRAVMVGDRIFDLQAAQGNHIPFIGCSYGYAPAGELDQADWMVDTPSQIPDAVDRLIG